MVLRDWKGTGSCRERERVVDKNASIAYTIRLVTHNHTLSRLIACSLEPRNLKTMYLAVPHFNVNNNNRSANPPYFHYSEIENSNIVVVPMQVDDLPTTDVMSMVHKPTSVTISDNDSDAVTECQHTGSGGFYTFWDRRRSLMERERLSRSRAQELSVRYELSDDRPDSLNKHAHVVPSVRDTKCLFSATNTTSSGSILQILFHNSNVSSNSCKRIGADPLLTKSDKKVECHTESKSSSLFRGKSLHIEIAHLLDEMSTDSESSTPLSVDETVASTPSPVYGNMYYASNGRSYWVKKLC